MITGVMVGVTVGVVAKSAGWVYSDKIGSVMGAVCGQSAAMISLSVSLVLEDATPIFKIFAKTGYVFALSLVIMIGVLESGDRVQQAMVVMLMMLGVETLVHQVIHW